MHATLGKGNAKLKTTLLQAKANQNVVGCSIKQVKQHSHKPSKLKRQKSTKSLEKQDLPEKVVTTVMKVPRSPQEFQSSKIECANEF